MEFGMLHWGVKVAIFCGVCFACSFFISVAESKSEQIKKVGERLLDFAFEMLENTVMIILAILS